MYNLNYDYESRWASYWHQIKEVLALKPQNILEIGIGNATVSNYLKHQGLEVATLDIDKELSPDVVANVLETPFQGNSFDVVLCAEVLEHLPFDDFEKCLAELKRVSKKYVVLTLPHFGPQVRFLCKIPLLKEVRIAFKIYFPEKHIFNGQHHWELGKQGYGLGKIKEIIKRYFAITKDFVPFENQYHHFFILEKKI